MVDKFEKAKYDKLQTKLSVSGKSPNTFKYAKLSLKDLVKDKSLICPFCMEIKTISDFEEQNSLYKCLKCKNRMTDNTLTLMFNWFNKERPDIDKFAKWVYEYRLDGFFQKIDFKKWNNNLYQLGYSLDFWGYYKMYKGEDKNIFTENDE